MRILMFLIIIKNTSMLTFLDFIIKIVNLRVLLNFNGGYYHHF